jgi:hypothetical protein
LRVPSWQRVRGWTRSVRVRWQRCETSAMSFQDQDAFSSDINKTLEFIHLGCVCEFDSRIIHFGIYFVKINKTF